MSGEEKDLAGAAVTRRQCLLGVRMGEDMVAGKKENGGKKDPPKSKGRFHAQKGEKWWLLGGKKWALDSG